MAFNNNKRTFSDINVTPLVDVMLVLLIIFMVTAPMLQQGIKVNLPQAKANNIKANEEKIMITITRDEKIYINKNPYKLNELGKTLKAINAYNREKQVFLKADKDVPYGFVVRVMSAIKDAGIKELGMVTEPLHG
ncbi:MAG: protein TolR [Deltaproteobacteria bacterium]|nr:protein TolR [Deltaproteobacteria bacterium]MCL5792875.1 protein TolR [Deltaproteobacteria bacterium]